MEREVVEIGGQRGSKASTISLQGLQSWDFDTDKVFIIIIIITITVIIIIIILLR